ncbi:hypothetical protein V6N12_074835 [Hibiscus sabdariffa]|uniref:Secreted protein n=1 Tax=Hibiscus sabdariffa TaxID=183260 RepID=A0ABR2D2L0_9ROSI
MVNYLAIALLILFQAATTSSHPSPIEASPWCAPESKPVAAHKNRLSTPAAAASHHHSSWTCPAHPRAANPRDMHHEGRRRGLVLQRSRSSNPTPHGPFNGPLTLNPLLHRCNAGPQPNIPAEALLGSKRLPLFVLCPPLTLVPAFMRKDLLCLHHIHHMLVRHPLMACNMPRNPLRKILPRAPCLVQCLILQSDIDEVGRTQCRAKKPCMATYNFLAMRRLRALPIFATENFRFASSSMILC